MKRFMEERGAMNLSLVWGLVMIAIAFIIFPIVLTGANTILTDAHIASYTGLSSVAAVAPLIIFVALLFGGGLMTFQGVRSSSRRRKK